jgi:hypothetical protein
MKISKKTATKKPGFLAPALAQIPMATGYWKILLLGIQVVL